MHNSLDLIQRILARKRILWGLVSTGEGVGIVEALIWNLIFENRKSGRERSHKLERVGVGKIPFRGLSSGEN